MQRYSLILAVLAVLLPAVMHAQDSARIVIISPRVGTDIDRAERDMYGLFRSLPDFQSATFFSHSGRYYAAVGLRAGEAARDTLIEYRERALLQMAERIDNHDLLSAGRYTMGSKPAVLLQGETVPLTALGVDKARLKAVTPLVLVLPPATDLPVAGHGTDLPAAAPATDVSSQRANVFLRSGSVIKGRVLSLDSTTLRIDADGLGVMTVPVAEVLSVNLGDATGTETPAPEKDDAVAVLPAQEGSPFRFSDPSSFRGFVLPTAYTVPRGEWYFSDDMIVIGTVGGGVANGFMMSGGTFLTLFEMFDESGLILHFNLKAQLFGGGGTAMSMGLAGLTSIGSESGLPLLPYMVVTTGNYDANISMVGGMTTILGEDGDTGTLLGVSGQTRVGPGVKLMFDAAYVPGADVVPGLIGVRFFGARMSGDVGLMFLVGEGNFEIGTRIPFANFTIFF